MKIHVEDRKSLTIIEYGLADTLISEERPQSLGAMVLCVERIAVQLKDHLGVGNGCVEWQLDHRKIDDVHKLFPDFTRERKPLKQLKRRNVRYLKKCAPKGG